MSCRGVPCRSLTSSFQKRPCEGGSVVDEVDYFTRFLSFVLRFGFNRSVHSGAQLLTGRAAHVKEPFTCFVFSGTALTVFPVLLQRSSAHYVQHSLSDNSVISTFTSVVLQGRRPSESQPHHFSPFRDPSHYQASIVRLLLTLSHPRPTVL